jgi:hypothetical protein
MISDVEVALVQKSSLCGVCARPYDLGALRVRHSHSPPISRCFVTTEGNDEGP